MPEALAWTLGFIAFLIVLAISIGLHEAGHMLIAKLFKLSVPKFFVGFGPTIWSKTTSKTEYGLKAVPLGGFVQIEDERQAEGAPERNLLSHVTPWKRILVFLAGPVVNLILGTAILVTMLMITPYQNVSTSISSVNTCTIASETGGSCTAEQAGLLAGDTVKLIDGKPVKTNADFAPLLEGKNKALITVERAGETLEIPANLTDNKLGINLRIDEMNRTLGEAFTGVGNVFVLNFESLSKIPEKIPGVFNSIFGATPDPEAPSSIVSVGKTYGDVSADEKLAAPDKVQMLLLYSGLLNIGLGVINLLPIMPLDGGRVLIALIDTVKIAWSKLLRRKYNPMGHKPVVAMTVVTGSLVFGFMALLIVSDVMQIIRGTM